MKRRAGIYAITSCAGGQYVGGSSDLRKRKNHHWHHLRRGLHPNKRLQDAWNEYGEAAFTFVTLLVCDPKDLLVFEQRALDALQPEYNIATNAADTRGTKRTPETRALQSSLKKGKKLSAEHVAAATAARMASPVWRAAKAKERGRIASPESRAKMSAAHRGKKQSPEHVAKRVMSRFMTMAAREGAEGGRDV